MKILLALDGSPFSDAVVDEVARRPWPADSEVKILSVFEHPILPMVEGWAPSGDYFAEIVKAAEEQAQNIVQKAARELRRHGKATSCESQPQSSKVSRDMPSWAKPRGGALI